jgi:hypothetical protein
MAMSGQVARTGGAGWFTGQVFPADRLCEPCAPRGCGPLISAAAKTLAPRARLAVPLFLARAAASRPGAQHG